MLYAARRRIGVLLPVLNREQSTLRDLVQKIRSDRRGDPILSHSNATAWDMYYLRSQIYRNLWRDAELRGHLVMPRARREPSVNRPSSTQISGYKSFMFEEFNGVDKRLLLNQLKQFFYRSYSRRDYEDMVKIFGDLHKNHRKFTSEEIIEKLHRALDEFKGPMNFKRVAFGVFVLVKVAKLSYNHRSFKGTYNFVSKCVTGLDYMLSFIFSQTSHNIESAEDISSVNQGIMPLRMIHEVLQYVKNTLPATVIYNRVAKNYDELHTNYNALVLNGLERLTNKIKSIVSFDTNISNKLDELQKDIEEIRDLLTCNENYSEVLERINEKIDCLSEGVIEFELLIPIIFVIKDFKTIYNQLLNKDVEQDLKQLKEDIESICGLKDSDVKDNSYYFFVKLAEQNKYFPTLYAQILYYLGRCQLKQEWNKVDEEHMNYMKDAIELRRLIDKNLKGTNPICDDFYNKKEINRTNNSIMFESAGLLLAKERNVILESGYLLKDEIKINEPQLEDIECCKSRFWELATMQDALPSARDQRLQEYATCQDILIKSGENQVDKIVIRARLIQLLSTDHICDKDAILPDPIAYIREQKDEIFNNLKNNLELRNNKMTGRNFFRACRLILEFLEDIKGLNSDLYNSLVDQVELCCDYVDKFDTTNPEVTESRFFDYTIRDMKNIREKIPEKEVKGKSKDSDTEIVRRVQGIDQNQYPSRIDCINILPEKSIVENKDWSWTGWVNYARDCCMGR